jgi:type IV secretory pathway VirB2 component (pilin)
MIKKIVAKVSNALLTPLFIAYAIFAFVYDESMGAQLSELLMPSAGHLIPTSLCVGLIAMPMLYLNHRTRFYAGMGFGLSGIYLLTIAWLDCLAWSQHFLNGFFYNIANLIPFIGCLVTSIVGLACKAKWIELAFVIVCTAAAIGSLYLCATIIHDDTLEDAPGPAPDTYGIAMGLVWLKTSAWATFTLAILPMLYLFGENAKTIAIILFAAACYMVLLGIGLAKRWKIALPFAIMSECSVAYSAYGQAMTADWHDTVTVCGQVFFLLLSLLGIAAYLLLMVPSNLSYYFRPGDAD